MAQTVFVLDVDGVLNVAVKGARKGAVKLDACNLAVAKNISPSDSEENVQFAGNFISVAERNIEGLGESAGSTYESFIADESALSPELVQRFAKLLEMAGENRMVVLSSSWRHPQHACSVKKLEQMIGEHLGKAFSFDAATPLTKEKTAEDRFDAIALFLNSYNKKASVPAAGQRVVIIDDLFATAMPGAVEYLKTKMQASDRVSVKFVHTYSEWNTTTGARVQVGSGLTMNLFNEIAHFLTVAPCVGKTDCRIRARVSL